MQSAAVLVFFGCLQICPIATQYKSVMVLKAGPISSLGGPFGIGMLYDARTSQLVPGMNLWDHESLNSKLTGTDASYSDFSLKALQTIHDYMQLIGVDGEFSMSILGGNLKIYGHAAVIRDQKNSNYEASVILTYKARTKFTQIPMESLQLSGIDYPAVLQKDLATHVVTGVLYGADASLLFRDDKKTDKLMWDVNAALSIDVKFKNKGKKDKKKDDKDESFSEKFEGVNGAGEAIVGSAKDGNPNEKTTAKRRRKRGVEESNNEGEEGDKSETEADMKAKQNSSSVSLNATVHWSKNDTKYFANMTVRFYGDFLLSENPVDFAKAVDVYRDLPTSLTDKQGAPKEVWLLPLAYINTKAAKLVQLVTENLVAQTEIIFDMYQTFVRRCGDLRRMESVAKFPHLGAVLDDFQSRLFNFWAKLSQELAKVLPEVRSKEGKMADLLAVFDRHRKSPFTEERLRLYVDKLEEEAEVLQAYVTNFAKLDFSLDPGDYSRKINDIQYGSLIIFKFQMFPSQQSEYLRLAQKYVADDNYDDSATLQQMQKWSPPDNWYDNDTIVSKVIGDAKAFRQFAITNKENDQDVYFLVGMEWAHNYSTVNESHSIVRMVDTQQTPFVCIGTVKHLKVKLSSSYSQVDLSWIVAKSFEDAIDDYNILYRRYNNSLRSENLPRWQIAVKKIRTKDSFTLDFFSPNTEYQVGVYANHKEFGRSELAISLPFRTAMVQTENTVVSCAQQYDIDVIRSCETPRNLFTRDDNEIMMTTAVCVADKMKDNQTTPVVIVGEFGSFIVHLPTGSSLNTCVYAGVDLQFLLLTGFTKTDMSYPDCTIDSEPDNVARCFRNEQKGVKADDKVTDVLSLFSWENIFTEAFTSYAQLFERPPNKSFVVVGRRRGFRLSCLNLRQPNCAFETKPDDVGSTTFQTGLWSLD